MRLVAVYDANILISAAISTTGRPARCLALARARQVELVTCQPILDDLEEKLVTKVGFSSEHARAARLEVSRVARMIAVTGAVRGITTDPDDDVVLECAVIGGATHVVTGDRRHLLPLHSYQGIAIVSAVDFLTLADEQGE